MSLRIARRMRSEPRHITIRRQRPLRTIADRLHSLQFPIMNNRRIVLTGAGRGLGLAMTEKLVELGHTVLGCSRQKANVEALLKRFKKPHRFDAVDVADEAA